MKKLWQFLTLYDRILILSIIIISVVFILTPLANLLAGTRVTNKEEQVIIIQASDESRRRIPMTDSFRQEPLLISVEGPIGTHLIEAHNGRVRVKEPPEADPHKICAKTGWIEEPGPMIICVPNRLSIWIEAEESELDGVSW